MSTGDRQPRRGGGWRRLHDWLVGTDGRAPTEAEIRGVAVLFLALFGFSGIDVAFEAERGPGPTPALAMALGILLLVVGCAMFTVFADKSWWLVGGRPSGLPFNDTPLRRRVYLILLATQGVLTALVVMLTGGLFKSPYAVFLLGGIILAQITAANTRTAIMVLLPFTVLCALAAIPPICVSSLRISGDWPIPHAIAPIIIVILASTWVNVSTVAERAARRKEANADVVDA